MGATAVYAEQKFSLIQASPYYRKCYTALEALSSYKGLYFLTNRRERMLYLPSTSYASLISAL